MSDDSEFARLRIVQRVFASIEYLDTLKKEEFKEKTLYEKVRDNEHIVPRIEFKEKTLYEKVRDNEHIVPRIKVNEKNKED